MSRIEAFALRGLVVAALGSSQEPFEVPDRGRRKPEPPSLDNIVTWHFIR